MVFGDGVSVERGHYAEAVVAALTQHNVVQESYARQLRVNDWRHVGVQNWITLRMFEDCCAR